MHYFFATLDLGRNMPISDCEVRDPRIRRTRQLLQGALRTLMQSKGFEEISVQDIAEEATVNRATFYDHYADKFALLDALVAGGFHQLLHAREVQFDGTCPSAASAIIEATCDYLAQIRAEHPDCGDKNSFEPLIDAAITSAIRRVLKGPPGNPVMDASPLSQMAATAAAWAIYGAARQWSLTTDRVPVAEVVPQILTFVLPMLQQANPASRTHEAQPASHASR
jgi:AcrR family transcriptional regulator